MYLFTILFVLHVVFFTSVESLSYYAFCQLKWCWWVLCLQFVGWWVCFAFLTAASVFSVNFIWLVIVWMFLLVKFESGACGQNSKYCVVVKCWRCNVRWWYLLVCGVCYSYPCLVSLESAFISNVSGILHGMWCTVWSLLYLCLI